MFILLQKIALLQQTTAGNSLLHMQSFFSKNELLGIDNLDTSPFILALALWTASNMILTSVAMPHYALEVCHCQAQVGSPSEYGATRFYHTWSRVQYFPSELYRAIRIPSVSVGFLPSVRSSSRNSAFTMLIADAEPNSCSFLAISDLIGLLNNSTLVTVDLEY
jgi:hypothetical protein